jgi:ABC-type transport system involved in cytochrome c biogenesis permease subunit
MNAVPTIAFALILASAAVQAFFLFARRGAKDTVSHWLLGASVLLLCVVVVARSIEMSFPALTGTFESLVFYAAFVCLVCLGYRLQRKLPFLPLVQFGATVIAAALLAIASSPIAPKAVLAPIPALRSGWLVLHVAFSFIGEAFFVASFVAALAFLATKDVEKRGAFDRIVYTAIAVGYPIFTTGALVFGAIWAERAWGRWWSWDPKETWALVTWLVYTFYLHVRFIRKRKDALPSLVAVLGFLCTIFTFFGVNFLLSGLHSYG